MPELANEQRAIIISVQADYDRVAEGIAERMSREPLIDQATRQAVEPGDEKFKCIAAQNVLRTCLEATLERMLPYALTTPVELGIRLASYCVSALPLDVQPGAVEEFCRVFAATHAERVAGGTHLQTTWYRSGQDGEEENVPAGRQ